MRRYDIIDYDGRRDTEAAALILCIQREDVGPQAPIEDQPELRSPRVGGLLSVALGAMRSIIKRPRARLCW